MGRKILYCDDMPSAKDLISLFFARDNVLLVNTKTITLTDSVVDELDDTNLNMNEHNIIFEIKVNPSLDSGARVYKIRARNRKSAIFFFLCTKVFKAYREMLSRFSSTIERMIKVAFVAKNERQAAISGDVFLGRIAAGKPQQNETSTDFTLIRRFRGLISKKNRQIERMLTSMKHAGVSVEAGPKLRTLALVESLEGLRGFEFPPSIHVALTTNCNLKCIMCPYHSEELRKDHTTAYFEHSKRMPGELLDKLIEEAGHHGSHLAFGQYDEPFVYKGFINYAVKAKRMGCGVSITTNGTLLTEEDARRLVTAGVDHISFSLDAATEETYRKIRLDDFNVPLENMKKLVQVRNALKGRTVLRACLVVQDYNRHEQDLFRDRMKEIGLDMVSFYVLSVYKHGMWLNEKLNFDIEVPETKGRYACSQLWSQVAVYPDGNVALCCATTLYVGYRNDVPYVGNIKEKSIQEIWLSSKYQQIREEALCGVFKNSVCRDCQIWHNYQNKVSYDKYGHMVLQNPYETFVHLRDP